MKTLPHFSIVVPCYNKVGTIVRCVRSILNQTFTDFELIIVDDGSTDGSVDQLSAVSDPRIRILRQPNLGVSAARNRGIQSSLGELIAFLDADDLWEPNFLLSIRKLRDAFPEAGLYSTGVGRCWLDGRSDLLVSVNQPASVLGILIEDYFTAVRYGDFITASNVCIPKKVFDHVGQFEPGVSLGEDIDLWARIAIYYPFACSAQILAWYFTPVGRTPHLMKPYEPKLLHVVLRLHNLLKEDAIPPSKRKTVEAYIDWQMWRYSLALLWQGNRQGLSDYMKSVTWLRATSKLRACLLSPA